MAGAVSSSLVMVAQQSHGAHVPGGVSQPTSQLCHHLLIWAANPRQPIPAQGSAPGGGTQSRPPLLEVHPTDRAHLSFSSLRWSMFRGFRRSLRIFFFFSRSVCFFPPFFSD